ncbi:MAG: hypothetical protein QNJ88_09325 [Acidimicrobiia bacterium]|nr:hypothetical protein [Acidimicrobiia bacterium]
MPYGFWWLHWLLIAALAVLVSHAAARWGRPRLEFAAAFVPIPVAVAIVYLAFRCSLPELDLFPADLKPPFPEKTRNCPANATAWGWAAVGAGYVAVVAIAPASWWLKRRTPSSTIEAVDAPRRR